MYCFRVHSLNITNKGLGLLTMILQEVSPTGASILLRMKSSLSIYRQRNDLLHPENPSYITFVCFMFSASECILQASLISNNSEIIERLTPRSPLSDVTNSPKKSQPALMSSFSVWPQPKPARQADFSEKERLAIKRIRALSPQHTDENCSNVVVNSRYFSAATIANDLPEENLAESENLEISDEDMQATFNDIHRLESMNNEKHDSLQQTIMLAEKEDTAIESPQNSGSQQTSNEKSTISMTRSSRFDAFTLTPPLSAKSGTHCPPLRQMTADSSPSSMISTPRLSSTTSSSLLTPLSSRPASFTEGTITPLLSKNRFLHFSAPCDSCESPLSTSLTRRPSVRRPTVNGKGIGSMPTLSKSSRTVSLDRYVSSNNIQAKRVRSETSTQRLKSAKSEAWSFQSHLDRFRAS